MTRSALWTLRPRRPGGRLRNAIVVLGAVSCAGCGTTALGAGQPDPTAAAKPTVSAAPASASSADGRYGIVARTLSFGSVPGNPWDVVVNVSLTAPSGGTTQIGAFYLGAGTWEFRFSPPESGSWQWRATLADGTISRSLTGSFTTQRSRTSGFIHVSAANPYLWSTESGSPYYPLGLQTCLFNNRDPSNPYGPLVLDGGFRPNGGKVPAGTPQRLEGAGGRQVSLDTYIRTYADAGFNLYRWTVNNCSFNLFQSISPGGNVYNAVYGRLGDQLVKTLHKYGMRVYMTFFNSPPGVGVGDASEMAAIERYVRYVVDRYGAYVDFWELMNEATKGSAWYAQITSYLRSIDPYHHPISTSFPPADLSQFDIDSPHWYESESEFASDTDTFNRFRAWKAAGKPVIVGEQGNEHRNWDPTSGLRMRLRIWTTFFSQGALIFWNEDAFKDLVSPSAGDIWLGPSEREYASVLSRFTGGFDPLAKMAKPSISQPGRVRGYELTGPSNLGLYLTAYTNHTSLTSGVAVTVDPTFAGTATWISPASGQVLGKFKVKPGTQRLKVPAFRIDVALKVVKAAR